MKPAKSTGGTVAIVARHRDVARAAAIRLHARLPRARLLPMSLPDYLRRRRDPAPLPVVLVADGGDPDRDRAFLESARDRLLWPAPGGDLYDALAGVLTSLPPRPRRSRPRRPEDAETTGLLLEGTVTSERALAALASPVRRWVVEHAASVRASPAQLARLAREGVTWSVLIPVPLLAVAASGPAARGLFPRGTPVWRIGAPGDDGDALSSASSGGRVPGPGRPASRARSRKSSPR